MPPDFFAPDFQVEINGSTLEADVSKFISRLSVVDELDEPDHFTLTLANPFPELRWTHDEKDSLLFKEGSEVKITMGYVGQTKEMFDGEITGISPIFPESGTPTVTINGASRMHRLKSSKKTRTFHNVTDKEIAALIAQDLKLEIEADETKRPFPYMIQYNQTDMAFLLQLASLAHFELKVKGKKLLFKKAQDVQTKDYTLVWGDPHKDVDPDRQRMPLRSFNPSINSLKPVHQVTVRGWDAMKKQKFEATAGPGAEEAKKGGETAAAVAEAAFNRRKEEVHVRTPIASQQEADLLAQALYNKHALELVTGTGATIGLSDLQAGIVVELAGLGPRFSGEYFVTQTTHSIGDGGYQTSFAVRRNSVG